ncbi:ribosomal-protein-alanine N-acetyltransferase [Domibacillus epiphyticus]|uniref:[Ribosomal protein bS18]-alanine N-acetyltransferase n=2 Tax=Domibacillus epiphyticus TaxID=1714355 RepID=A0A1V2AB25_9BACI|nr:ribosomal-protein-alanine N-acetyltransferase [Domibacillus epiphyticus]
MTLEDIPAVYEVELVSFAIPWSKEAFEREISSNRFALYHVAEINGQVIGYCGMWVVYDQVQITNIAILPEYRGNHYGEKLMAYVMKEAKRYGGAVLSLEVRVSNTPARSLYEKFGLQPGGIRKQYYTDNLEDALVMWVNL